MPELPEVERARKLIADTCVGYTIDSVTVAEDKIVYTGGSDHNDFAKELTGRVIEGSERKGKLFWLNLSGEGRHPVLHFGMTGMIQLKGQDPTWYRRRPKEKSDVWPPRFHKFILQLSPPTAGGEPRELAFLDGRRLARIRLLPSPVLDHPPLSDLGFDPVLSHPTIDGFRALIEKKKGTVKGLIMDQAFSAGVGNWVADEILYQAAIHPMTPVPHLTDTQISALHYNIRQVPLTAVSVNADSSQFPEGWLFRWRWDKGKVNRAAKGRKKQEEGEEEDVKPKGKDHMVLPDGRKATIKFIEVGGRTTAVVEEVQKLPEGLEVKPKATRKKGKEASDSELSEPQVEDKPKRGKRKPKIVKDADSEGSLTDLEEVSKPTRQTARQRARVAKAEVNTEVEDFKPDVKPDEAPRKRARKA
ncbi:hypothetical protein Q5752_005093 [Cryptotrichosporon argae]